jgi:hypothetical protein
VAWVIDVGFYCLQIALSKNCVVFDKDLLICHHQDPKMSPNLVCVLTVNIKIVLVVDELEIFKCYFQNN